MRCRFTCAEKAECRTNDCVPTMPKARWIGLWSKKVLELRTNATADRKGARPGSRRSSTTAHQVAGASDTYVACRKHVGVLIRDIPPRPAMKRSGQQFRPGLVRKQLRRNCAGKQRLHRNSSRNCTGRPTIKGELVLCFSRRASLISFGRSSKQTEMCFRAHAQSIHGYAVSSSGRSGSMP